MDELHAVMLICESAIFLPTVIGNTLILICLFKFRRLRTPMGILIGSLASTDLFTGAVVIPLDVFGLTNNIYDNSKYACLVRLGTFVVLLGTSILNMLAISTERFVSLAYPLKHMSSKTIVFVKCFISLSWVSMIVIGFFPLFGFNSYNPDLICKYTVQFLKGYSYFVTIFYAICIFINIAFFIILIKIVFSTLRGKHVIRSSSRVIHNLKKTYIMLIISASFILCWGPFSILSFIGLFHQWDTYNTTMRYCIILGFLNSGFNWMIYGFANAKFRRAITSLLKRKRDDLSTFSTSYNSGTLSIRHI